MSGTAADCPTCGGRLEIPALPAQLPQSPGDDPAFHSARKFLCGSIRVEFFLFCLGSPLIVVEFVFSLLRGAVTLLLFTLILVGLRCGIHWLKKGRGVAGWSIGLAIWSMICALVMIIFYFPAVGVDSGKVVAMIFWLLLHSCVFAGCIWTLVSWRQASR